MADYETKQNESLSSREILSSPSTSVPCLMMREYLEMAKMVILGLLGSEEEKE